MTNLAFQWIVHLGLYLESLSSLLVPFGFAAFVQMLFNPLHFPNLPACYHIILIMIFLIHMILTCTLNRVKLVWLQVLFISRDRDGLKLPILAQFFTMNTDFPPNFLIQD